MYSIEKLKGGRNAVGGTPSDLPFSFGLSHDQLVRREIGTPQGRIRHQPEQTVILCLQP